MSSASFCSGVTRAPEHELRHRAGASIGVDRDGGLHVAIDPRIGGRRRKLRLAGQLEAQAATRCAKNNGLLFSEAEINAFNEIAGEIRKPKWNLADFKVAE